MPSAPPSSAESRNTPNAIAGSKNVVSATVRSVNQDVPPSIRDGICKIRHSCEIDRIQDCSVHAQHSCPMFCDQVHLHS